jgi:NhaP-type Na+/H+ or K+/H+ antiporter
LQFNSEVFFTFILPPIIFAAGYNLRRQSFFKYFLYIMLFGVIGTIITFSVVAPLTYFANSNKLFWYSTKTQNNTFTNSTNINDTIYDIDSVEENLINFSIKEILLFSSVISATDTVAALTFVKEESEPKLFAILFGEGVINDAVCIVLYNIIKNFFASSKQGRISLI